jgi:hypothetical protein
MCDTNVTVQATACRLRLRVAVVLGGVLAFMLPLSDALAQNYSVHVLATLDDLDVKIEPVTNTGMLVIRLTNKNAIKVRCDLRYDAPPQALYRTTTYVDPGKTEQSVFRARREWFAVNVNVECTPAKK